MNSLCYGRALTMICASLLLAGCRSSSPSPARLHPAVRWIHTPPSGMHGPGYVADLQPGNGCAILLESSLGDHWSRKTALAYESGRTVFGQVVHPENTLTDNDKVSIPRGYSQDEDASTVLPVSSTASGFMVYSPPDSGPGDVAVYTGQGVVLLYRPLERQLCIGRIGMSVRQYVVLVQDAAGAPRYRLSGEPTHALRVWDQNLLVASVASPRPRVLCIDLMRVPQVLSRLRIEPPASDLPELPD